MSTAIISIPAVLCSGCVETRSPLSAGESDSSATRHDGTAEYLGDDAIYDVLRDTGLIVEESLPVLSAGLPTAEDISQKAQLSSDVQVAPSRCETFAIDGFNLSLGQRGTFQKFETTNPGTNALSVFLWGFRVPEDFLKQLEETLEGCSSWSQTQPSFDYVSSIGESVDLKEANLVDAKRVSANILWASWHYRIDDQVVDSENECIFGRTDCRIVYEIVVDQYWIGVGENGALVSALLSQEGIRSYGVEVPEDSPIHWDESDKDLTPVAERLVEGLMGGVEK